MLLRHRRRSNLASIFETQDKAGEHQIALTNQPDLIGFIATVVSRIEGMSELDR